MKIVVLGLSLSSSWGNGHATTFRALLGALGPGHDVLFLEREQPWYAENRDLPAPEFCRLAFYHGVSELDGWRREIAAADAVVVGSYVPEGAAVTLRIRPWVRGVFAFYDIDTPVTLATLDAGTCGYLTPETVTLFDVYFSFTGGPMLRRLERDYGARRAVALYCSVDERRYRPMGAEKRWDLGYLGTYSPDRQPVLERLLLEPARRLPEQKFVVAGPMYPAAIDWPANVERIEHLPPAEHAAFYNAQAWTLNVTRADMVAAGYSPSVRLFEAAACGVPIVSDVWDGIGTIFTPGTEIVLARGADDVVAALAMPAAARAAIGDAARARTLAAHTASHRADELLAALQTASALQMEGAAP